VTIDENGEDPAVVVVMLQAPSWEFHFGVHLSELGRLRVIRGADWSSRRSLRVGDAAGIPVHWCMNSDDDTVTALVGNDDETWHIAFVMPVETIDRLLAEAVDLLPPADPSSVPADQTKVF
jgi:hypothetical protein